MKPVLARLAVLIGISFVAMGAATLGDPDVTSDVPFQTYSDVLSALKQSYYGSPIDQQQMTYNAIRGMVGSLNDRFTRFMDPKEYADEMDQNQGEYAGIGALIASNGRHQVYIVRPLPSSPALRAGVMAGDVVHAVDGRVVEYMSMEAAVKFIIGKPHTAVKLTLLRKGVARPVVITVVRQTLPKKIVWHAVIDAKRKIGYLVLPSFDEQSDAQMEEGIRDLQAQGVRGLILDLRDNGGGLVNVSQEIGSRFIRPGVYVWLKNRTDPLQPLETIPQQVCWHGPLAVLVNGNSASASEMLSGAIKDTGTGILVGEKTYGKGIMQTVMQLNDGSGMAVTTQHYFTVNMHDINHKGIIPNVVVKLTDMDERKMLAFWKDHPGIQYDTKDDPQLQRAIELVASRLGEH